MRPSQTKHHNKPKVFIHKDLHTASHVFLRKDTMRKSLEPPYEESFPVVGHVSDRVFKVEIKEETITISIERLKPAYLINLIANDVPELNVPKPNLNVPKTYKKRTVRSAT